MDGQAQTPAVAPSNCTHTFARHCDASVQLVPVAPRAGKVGVSLAVGASVLVTKPVVGLARGGRLVVGVVMVFPDGPTSRPMELSVA